MHHHFSLPAVCRKKGPVLSTIQLEGKADQTNLYAHPYSLFALLAFSQIWYLTETFSKKHYICTQTCLLFRETDLSTKQFARLKSISSLYTKQTCLLHISLLAFFEILPTYFYSIPRTI